MEYPVHKANAWALIGVLIWQFDVNLPETALEGSYDSSAVPKEIKVSRHTLFWAFKPDVELLPMLCQRCCGEPWSSRKGTNTDSC